MMKSGEDEMFLGELQAGAKVNLVMVKNFKAYEVSTSVAGVSYEMPNMVLLAPFEYKGSILEFSNPVFENVTFQLYSDDANGNRVGWMGVDVKLQNYKGHTYYVVTAPVYGSVSKPNDRRHHARVEVGMRGTLIVQESDEKNEIEVCDISAEGISFICEDDMALINRMCKITFSECINGENYDLAMECQCVRKTEKGNKYFYGCRVNEQSRLGLTYIYIKKIMSKN